MIGLKRGSCPADIADVRTWISPNLSSLFCESRSIVTDCSPGVVPRLNKKVYIKYKISTARCRKRFFKLFSHGILQTHGM